MDDSAETTILEDGNVKITNLKVTIGSKVYPLSDIVSVRNVGEYVNPTCLGIVLVTMVLSFSAVIFFKRWYWIPPYIGCLLVVFGYLILSMLFNIGGKGTSMVQIETTSGKSNILKSTDNDHIQRVVDAMKDAIVHYQEAALQAYLDAMRALLLEKGLRSSNNKEVHKVATKQTLTMLRRFDATRKGIVLRFLHEVGLISKETSIVDLGDADLRDVNLSFGDLRNVNLRNANLSKAILSNVNLTGAVLSGANLRDADLSFCDVRNANLTGAALNGANLRYADLSDAPLTDANFTNAILKDAKISKEQLATAKSLKGATMPDGTKHD